MYDKCKMLTQFYNVKQYLHLLPLHEQMTEINKMIDYYSKLNHACYNVKKNIQPDRAAEKFKTFNNSKSCSTIKR